MGFSSNFHHLVSASRCKHNTDFMKDLIKKNRHIFKKNVIFKGSKTVMFLNIVGMRPKIR